MVRDVFRLARENAPAIIFIDEIDAIATKRFDAQTGADHEVQRILLELLNQMDGFDQTTNIKVYHSNSPAFKKIQLIGICVQRFDDWHYAANCRLIMHNHYVIPEIGKIFA